MISIHGTLWGLFLSSPDSLIIDENNNKTYMITTTMSATEVLCEYKGDYQMYLKQRVSSVATRRTHDLKVAKGKWVKNPDLTINTPTGNKYTLLCKLRWDRRRGHGWTTTAFLSLPDTRTGRKVAFILSDDFPILLTSSFLRELGMEVSEFLRSGATWDVVSVCTEEPKYTDYIDFGENIGAGVGGWKDGVLVLRHLLKDWEENPVSEYLRSKEEEEKDPDIPKSDIDKAWEEYLSGELTV